METRICPYCKEEIKIDAIKCKHCKEFLNLHTKSTENSSKTNKGIVHQNFNTAIFVGVLSILLSFVEVNNINNQTNEFNLTITLFSGFSYLWLWLFFRKYLLNFNDTKAIILTNWIVVMNILMLLLDFAIAISESLNTNSEEWHKYDSLAILLLILNTVFSIINIVIYINAGIAFQKIRNDYVGLLKEFGMSVAYILPIQLFLLLVGITLENNTFIFLGTVFNNISNVILIMIFIRAKKKLENPYHDTSN